MTPLPLITGATGFAGGHLLERLLEGADPTEGGPSSVPRGAAPRIHAWGNPSGRPLPAGAATDPRVAWRAVDLLDRSAVREALAATRPGVIYHCAGIADVQGSWDRPVRALRTNVLGTHNLLEAARDAGIASSVLVTGSSLVYKPSGEAITENHPIGPTTPYGVSKLAQEMTAGASALPVLMARSFNHAGPRQDTGYVTSAFARQLAEIEAGVSPPVLRVGNLDSRRDITDVRDTVRAYIALVERGTAGRPYNVCSGHTYRIRDLLDILLALARVPVRVETDPARLRPSDNPVVLGSHARITADTGWTPLIPIERTLADLLEYWRERLRAGLRQPQ